LRLDVLIKFGRINIMLSKPAVERRGVHRLDVHDGGGTDAPASEALTRFHRAISCGSNGYRVFLSAMRPYRIRSMTTATKAASVSTPKSQSRP